MLNGVSLRTIGPPRVALSKGPLYRGRSHHGRQAAGRHRRMAHTERCREDYPKVPVIYATYFSPVAPSAGG